MKIDELKEQLKEGDIEYHGICHDCKCSVAVTAKLAEDGAITIEGGAIYEVKQGEERLLFFKCDKCFKKDHTLRNWKPCEVYSRVVGYLRPVQQWNKGKKAEWDARKEFVNTKEEKKIK